MPYRAPVVHCNPIEVSLPVVGPPVCFPGGEPALPPGGTALCSVCQNKVYENEGYSSSG